MKLIKLYHNLQGSYQKPDRISELGCRRSSFRESREERVLNKEGLGNIEARIY